MKIFLGILLFMGIAESSQKMCAFYLNQMNKHIDKYVEYIIHEDIENSCINIKLAISDAIEAKVECKVMKDKKLDATIMDRLLESEDLYSKKCQ